MLLARDCIATNDNDTLRHVTAVGRVHFYKQLVDDDAFSSFQPLQKHTMHKTLATFLFCQIKPHHSTYLETIQCFSIQHITNLVFGSLFGSQPNLL